MLQSLCAEPLYFNPNWVGFLGVCFEVGGGRLLSPTWPHCLIFWRCIVSLVKFSYWSKFHVNIFTGSGVMTISFYEASTRNSEIGNTPAWVLPNIWRLGQIRNIKFCMILSNKMLLNAAKPQGYGFYRFWVIKGNPTWGSKINPPSPTPTQVRV